MCSGAPTVAVRAVVGLAGNTENRSEASIDVVEDGWSRPEVRGDLENVVRPQTFDGGARLDVRADIGAPEPVDRLLGIADHEKRSGPQAYVLPSLSRLGGGDPEKDLGLQRIGILEIIDEDMLVPLSQSATHSIVAAH